jgi:hypothetical protein
MSDLFISYSRDDREFVEKLHTAIKSSKRDAWMDTYDIDKGEKFWLTIEQGINAANSFAFVITKTSIEKSGGEWEKQHCRREIEYAAQEKKRIIPIVWVDQFDPNERVEDLLNEEIPAHRELKERNWIKFSNEDFESCFSELLKAAEKDIDYVKRHTQLLQNAKKWENGGQSYSDLLRGKSLIDAEDWLKLGDKKAQLQREESWRKHRDPEPTAEHRNFIRQSRLDEDARLRRDSLMKKSITWGGSILGVSLIGAGIAGWSAVKAIQARDQAQVIQKEAQEGTRLERDAREALAQFQDNQTEGLLSAVRAGSELKEIVKDGRQVSQYPTVTPIFTLQKILEQSQELYVEGSYPKLHPSGKILATLNSNQKVVDLFDLQGKKLASLQVSNWDGKIIDFDFSRNGEILIARTEAGTQTIVWQLPMEQDLSQAVGKVLPGGGAVFNADRDKFATYEEGQGIRIWNSVGEEVSRVSVDNLHVAPESLAFSSNGKFIAARLHADKSIAKTNILKVWDLSGKETRNINSERGVNSFLMSKDAQRIIIVESDLSPKLWNWAVQSS